MNPKHKYNSALLGISGILNPKGMVAIQQKNLIIEAVLLMLIIVIPVLILTIVFARKYRASRPKEKYTPNWDRSPKLQTALWAIPTIMIVVLGSITWKATHKLDPYEPIASAKEPITIQVIALEWKWLFIYPKQNIASVNFVQFPANTPVQFELTANNLMNSFWIPQLGSQMYAMQGMTTKLNLMANESGEYPGQAAEINGKGYSDMRFTAKATTQSDFDHWVAATKKSSQMLHWDQYQKLTQPSENNSTAVYSMVEPDLYNKILMQYMPLTSSHIH